jgi:Domain of unknown function (DUF4190)
VVRDPSSRVRVSGVCESTVVTDGGGSSGPDDTREQAPRLRPYGSANVPDAPGPVTPPPPPPYAAPPPPPASAPSAQPVPPLSAPRYPAEPPFAGYARASGLAVASLVLGIVWVLWIGSLLAVIFGHVALSQIKRSYGALTGRGMAIAGLVLGYLGIATLALVIVLSETGVIDAATAAECRADRARLVVAETRYFDANGHYTDEPSLVASGLLDEESDLHSIELLGGGPGSATDYAIVAESACE